MSVSERILAPLVAATSTTTPSSQNVYPKVAPLRLLYDIYLFYYQLDDKSPFKDEFARIRMELAKTMFSLGEQGPLESILSKNTQLNNAPLWRLLVNVQTSLGWKSKAAASCLQMASFADAANMSAVAATAREEAYTLDPTKKPENIEDPTISFMTKEELRKATHEEIVKGFLKDPNIATNYDHLIDLLEDEGAIMSAIRVIVAYSLTKNVPAQFQANVATHLRRVISLFSRLQTKYLTQLQLIHCEVNQLREQLNSGPYLTPDLESLLKQIANEEEFKPFIPRVLETIANQLAPPQLPTNTTPNVLPSYVLGPLSQDKAQINSTAPASAIPATSQKVAMRSSWGIKPAAGKERNKRFTMGIKSPSNPSIGIGSRTPDLGTGDSKQALSSSFPLVMGGTRNEDQGIGVIAITKRAATPSTTTPFQIVPSLVAGVIEEDSPFSSTVFNGMPDQLPDSGRLQAKSTPSDPATNPLNNSNHLHSSQQSNNSNEPPLPIPDDEDAPPPPIEDFDAHGNPLLSSSASIPSSESDITSSAVSSASSSYNKSTHSVTPMSPSSPAPQTPNPVPGGPAYLAPNSTDNLQGNNIASWNLQQPPVTTVPNQVSQQPKPPSSIRMHSPTPNIIKIEPPINLGMGNHSNTGLVHSTSNPAVPPSPASGFGSNPGLVPSTSNSSLTATPPPPLVLSPSVSNSALAKTPDPNISPSPSFVGIMNPSPMTPSNPDPTGISHSPLNGVGNQPLTGPTPLTGPARTGPHTTFSWNPSSGGGSGLPPSSYLSSPGYLSISPNPALNPALNPGYIGAKGPALNMNPTMSPPPAASYNNSTVSPVPSSANPAISPLNPSLSSAPSTGIPSTTLYSYSNPGLMNPALTPPQ